MARFITGEKLSEQVYDIIFSARKQLLIVSPYIKLDDYFKKEVFNRHKTNPELHIVVAFGKNENNPTRSFNREDFDYFKEFKNISIVYVPTLHAKYYANESKGVITSLNLYDYSFKNNIEFGVVSERKFIEIGSTTLDVQAWDESEEILVQNYCVFIRRPRYKKKLLIGKDYLGSEVLLDLTEELLKGETIEKRSLDEFMDKDFVDVDEQRTRRTRSEYDFDITIENALSKSKGVLLSGTALGKTKGKTFAEVKEIMELHQLVIDNEITQKGLNAGITRKSNNKGASWLVYPQALNVLLE